MVIVGFKLYAANLKKTEEIMGRIYAHCGLVCWVNRLTVEIG